MVIVVIQLCFLTRNLPRTRRFYHGKLEISSRNIHIRLWMERSNSISQEFYLPEVNPFSLEFFWKCLSKEALYFQMCHRNTNHLQLCRSKSNGKYHVPLKELWYRSVRYPHTLNILFAGLIHHQSLWRSAGEEAARLFKMQHLPPVCLRAWRPVCF